MTARSPLTVEELFDRVVFERYRLKKLSALYSRFYRALIAETAPVLSRLQGVHPAAASIAAREAIVPLAHFYLDRLLRLDSLKQSEGTFAVAALAARPYPARAETFTREATFSRRFNQAQLARLAPLFDLKTVAVAEPEEAGLRAATGSFRNYNFMPSTVTGKARRVLLCLRWLAAGGRPLPALSMAYSTQALKDEGFFPAVLKNIRGRAVLKDGRPEPAARQAIHDAVCRCREALDIFLAEAGFQSCATLPRVAEDWARFAGEAFPSSLLEALSSNISACIAVLQPFKPRPLIASEVRNLESTSMLAAARTLGLETIGIQHGGHYGYIADLASILELEYGHFDRFITWGWEEGPERTAFPDTRFIALPNPWLSARRPLLGDWYRSMTRAAKAYDALFLSSRIDRFARAPSGAGNLSRDFLQPYCRFLAELGPASKGSGLKILHKPFHADVIERHEQAMQEMELLSGGAIERLRSADKGLNGQLLSQCRVVVWDLPGTGFLECLAAGIQTICCWPRISIEEEETARPFFEALESAGIVQKTVDGLMRELKTCLSSPQAWAQRPQAKAAIDRFLSRYGRVSDAWPQDWQLHLDELRRP